MSGFVIRSPLLLRRLDAAAQEFLQPPGSPVIDFALPVGEPALVPPDSVAWQIFKNPVVLFIGGVAAVILELAEPGVRTGVWDHSSFRTDPVARLRRTGLAAMINVYGARSLAETMIAKVVRAHGNVSGDTPAGQPYRANDVGLLSWVQATAGFGFGESYHRFVRPLSSAERDRFYAEGAPSARLYGALDAPVSHDGMQALFGAMRPRLEPSPIIFEFLQIMRDAPALPAPLRPLQRMLIRAAVEIVPEWVRERLELTAHQALRPWERPVVRYAAGLFDRMTLPSSPAVQSCRRLGLAADFLYRR
ncbi:MAG: hypothetical protein JWR10_173 [Rubritepida sp.]|nr:hypothetical protein [Rubritepida sp.]